MRKSALCLLFPLLAGCVTTPPFQLSESQQAVIPAGWDAPQPAADTGIELALWWQSWTDPELARLVAASSEANTDIISAKANLRAALAMTTIADAALWPSADGSASAGRRHSNSRGSNNFSIGLNGVWSLDAGGNLAASQASQADYLASLATLGQVQAAVAAQVARSYVNLRLAQRQAEVARENLKTQQQALEIASWRYRSGLVDSTDVDQARTSLSQTQANLPVYLASVKQYRNLLAVLTSKKPSEIGLEKVKNIPLPPENIALDIPAATLRQNPSVRAAEARVKAAMARHTEALSALYPSFQITGSFGLAGVTIGSLGDPGTASSSILGSINLPIFNAGRLRAQVEQRDSQVQAANAAYEKALLEGVQGVEDALNDIWSRKLRKVSLESAVKSARSAAQSAQQNYAAGLQDFTVVLTTQRTLLSVQEQLANADAQIATAYIDLYEALGGGWQPAVAFEENKHE